MTRKMENSRWFREKRAVIDKYLSAHQQAEQVVAGRGFLYRPGFLGAAITQVERDSKFKLSGINYEITAQAIERELAQTGHAYDISYKSARIAWEFEKTELLTALDREFADNKRVRELDNQELDRLEITTHLRKLVIMALKTAIDVDMAALRQEMTRVDQSTFYAEDALLSARLVTAQKKLEVIPFIEAVLAKQQGIIDAETANADRKRSLAAVKRALNGKRVELITAREAIADAIIPLIAAKQALVDKKGDLVDARDLVADQETVNVSYLNQYISALSGLGDVRQDLISAKKALIPHINKKSAALIAYAAEMDAWVIVRESIAAAKESIAAAMVTRVGRKGDIIKSRVSLNALNLRLQEAHMNLEIAKLTGRSDLMTQKIANAGKMLTERQEAFEAGITRESELLSGRIDLDLYESQVAFDTMMGVNDVEIDAEVDSLERVVRARIKEREGVASAASTAEITSELVHLLS